jgi:hypothetical protein
LGLAAFQHSVGIEATGILSCRDRASGDAMIDSDLLLHHRAITAVARRTD